MQKPPKLDFGLELRAEMISKEEVRLVIRREQERLLDC